MTIISALGFSSIVVTNFLRRWWSQYLFVQGNNSEEKKKTKTENGG